MSCPHCEHEKHEQPSHACCCGSHHVEHHSGGCCCGSSHHSGSCCGGSGSTNLKRDLVVLAISAVSLIIGFAISHFHVHVPFFPLTDPSWIAVILCGLPLYRSAAEAIFEDKKITTSLLVSVAITAALALQFFVSFGGISGGGHAHDSYIFAAGEISFLMALGEMIEEWTVKKSRKGIEALVALAPKLAVRKKSDGTTEVVKAEELVPGDIVFVRPNDMIPADGTVVDGESSVNQASLTGESVPVDKGVGDSVLAGTWNSSGALTLRVEKPSSENTISRLIKLVREAEEKKAPIQHVADRWASRIVPAAIICSVLVFLFAFFVLKEPALESVVRGVTILVVFCPCAFALATPTAIAAGVGNASRRGVLVKSGEALEKLVGINEVVFDKTGTLTRAELKIESEFAAENFSCDEALALAAAAESQSQHPVAQAVIAEARARKLTVPEAHNIAAQTGVGVSCEVGGREILVRSFKSLENSGNVLPDGAREFAERRREHGETLICVVVDSVFAGIFSLSDTFKENAPAAISALKKSGIGTAILSGDNAAAANRAGEIVGVDEVFAELLPEDKSSKISAMRAGGRRVLMVGDGVNDAPALAAADCSVAMGALGSELAVETADIAILNDDIALVPGLIKFSKAVLRTIHINFGISLVINFSAVALSAYGVLDPVTGALVHNASSVIVVSHSALLLLRQKDFPKKKN